MKWLYHKYCQAQAASAPLKEDIEAEYNHQREYLEKTVDGLKRKLKKDSGMLRGDNLRILHENTALLKEVRACACTAAAFAASFAAAGAALACSLARCLRCGATALLDMQHRYQPR